MNFEEDELKEGDEDPEFTGTGGADDDIDDDFVDDDLPLGEEEVPEGIGDEEEEEEHAADL